VTHDEYLSKCTAIPIATACQPPTDDGIFLALSSVWWLATSEDEILFSSGSPTYDLNKSVLERFAKNYPDLKVVFLPKVFLELDCSDFWFIGGDKIGSKEQPK
jgi:hypothetical protein